MNTDTAPSLIQKALFAIRSLGMVVVRSGRNQTLNSDYATYSDIWRMLQEPLKEHKLAVGFLPGVVRKEGEKESATFTQTITMIVMHEAGESLSQPFEVLLPDSNRATNRTMCQGMAQTYGKRYALVNVFNLILDNDDDAETLGQGPERIAEAQPDVGAHWGRYCHCPHFGAGEEEQRGGWGVLSNPENPEQMLGDLKASALAGLWMRKPTVGLDAWRAELVDDRARARNIQTWEACRVAFKALHLPEKFTDCTGEQLNALGLALKQ